VEAATSAGLDATVVIDQPHHTDAWRWFLKVEPACKKSALISQPKCALYHGSGAACVLCLPTNEARVDETHVDWMVTEHAKFARKLIRTVKHINGKQGNGPGLTIQGAESTGGEVAVNDDDVNDAIPKGKKARTKKRKKGHGLSGFEAVVGEALTRRFGEDVSLDDLRGIRKNDLMAFLHNYTDKIPALATFN